MAGAFLLALPAVGFLTLMWPYRHMPGQKIAHVVAEPVRWSWTVLRKLLITRDFGMLLLGCVVPFSIAQVGLLTYRSEEHTSELQSLMRISYAVFCLKNTKLTISNHYNA